MSRRAPRRAAKSPQKWHLLVSLSSFVARFYPQICGNSLALEGKKNKPKKTHPNLETVLNCSIGFIKGKKPKIASLKKNFLRLTMQLVGLMKLEILPGFGFGISVILKNNPQMEPKSSKTPLSSPDEQKQKETSGIWREDPGTDSVFTPLR